ncbi:uncharacterized protein An11g06840 [Aspergillus niger]|uniref:Contig An11c0240, genomic contig n=2 Tax=Aspergillus niger TaxID=5061 RepID=A2QWX9_ASPNC|nr:uncharacterized protein An11g06840 [Aspergillus niger]CAK96981.1 unnamed protein product [Aspergillus niger]
MPDTNTTTTCYMTVIGIACPIKPSYATTEY